MDVRREKETIQENRRFREDQYAERRQKDYEEALDREAHFYEKSRKDYEEQTEMQLVQHKEILAAKAAKRHKRNTEYCREVVFNLIEIAFKVNPL